MTMTYRSFFVIIVLALQTADSFAPFIHQTPSGLICQRPAVHKSILLSSPRPETSSADLDRLRQVDSTLKTLRRQLPLVLIKALDKSSAAKVYDENTILLGPKDELLASDRDELTSLSTTLVTASAATQRATQLARSLTATSGNGVNNILGAEEDRSVSCIIILEDSDSIERFQVQWNTSLLGTEGSSRVSGFSELTLNDAGLVSRHKVLHLDIDGAPVNAVGEALAAVRRAVKTVQASPLFSGTLPRFLTDIRDELIAVQQQSVDMKDEVELPPIYVSKSLSTNFTGSNSLGNLTLIDDSVADKPFPGSDRWSEYIMSQDIFNQFTERIIPLLSKGSPKDELFGIFNSSCQLRGIDGTALCSKGDEVASFYRTLASIRKGTFGSWNVRGISSDWKTLSVTVEYVASNPIRVEGKDRYVLSDSGLIQQVEQLELVVGGTVVQDPEWFRQFYQAAKTSQNTVGADLVMDLLQQVSSTTKPDTGLKLETNSQPLNEKAAASVYGILTSLHRDLASLSTLTTAPASEYIAPSIELKGYLNEVLSRGETNYRTAIHVVLASFRGSLASGGLYLDQPPKPTIIFQADGQIRVDLLLQLRVKTFDRGLPLKLELGSCYRVSKEGKIVEHTIIETRVNGQLTPGDVVARFLKRNNADIPVPESAEVFLDALNWARRNFQAMGGK